MLGAGRLRTGELQLRHVVSINSRSRSYIVRLVYFARHIRETCVLKLRYYHYNLPRKLDLKAWSSAVLQSYRSVDFLLASTR